MVQRSERSFQRLALPVFVICLVAHFIRCARTSEESHPSEKALPFAISAKVGLRCRARRE